MITNNRYSSMTAYAALFFGALVMRWILGTVFLGSVDLLNAVEISQRTIKHDFNCYGAVGNYFPLMMILYWFGALCMVKSVWTFAICYKMLPMIADSLLAVLIAMMVARRRSSQALLAGWLYALSPLALMITSIHFHWEPVFLFYMVLAFYLRDYVVSTLLTYVLFGVCLAIAVLLKPTALIAVPFFFTPRQQLRSELGAWWSYSVVTLGALTIALIAGFALFKMTTFSVRDLVTAYWLVILTTLVLWLLGTVVWMFVYKPAHHLEQARSYLRLQQASLIGFVGTMIVACGVFMVMGFDLVARIEWILRYMNQGVQIFGLPLAYPFNLGLLHLILKNRFWQVIGIAWIASGYYKERYDAVTAVAYSMAMVLGFSGMGCQYLLWLLPWLALSQHTRWYLVYTATAALFVLLYDVHPFANPDVAYQCVSCFVPLQSFAWLSPASVWTSSWLLPIIRTIGNYVIPFLCIALWLWGLHCARHVSVLHARVTPVIVRWWMLLVLVMYAVTAWIHVTYGPAITLESFDGAWHTKLSWYYYDQIAGRIIPFYSTWHWYDPITIGLAIIVAWVIVAYGFMRKGNNSCSE